MELLLVPLLESCTLLTVREEDELVVVVPPGLTVTWVLVLVGQPLALTTFVSAPLGCTTAAQLSLLLRTTLELVYGVLLGLGEEQLLGWTTFVSAPLGCTTKGHPST